jgi:putative NADH-flavin reductase
MSDPASIDPYVELFGLDLPPERLQEVRAAYADILGEIQKLRSLDLTDVHPAVVFEPTAPYRKTP